MAFSSVKSLTIDGWNERQLKAMSLGGNKRLKVFFQEFDLLEELPQNKYKTIAADYNQGKLRAEAFGEQFFEEKPDFMQGKTVVPEKLRSPEEIMANNPPY